MRIICDNRIPSVFHSCKILHSCKKSEHLINNFWKKTVNIPTKDLQSWFYSKNFHVWHGSNSLFGHIWGTDHEVSSLTWCQSLVNCRIQSEGHREPRNEVGYLSPSIKWVLYHNPSNFGCDALTNWATLPTTDIGSNCNEVSYFLRTSLVIFISLDFKKWKATLHIKRPWF